MAPSHHIRQLQFLQLALRHQPFFRPSPSAIVSPNHHVQIGPRQPDSLDDAGLQFLVKHPWRKGIVLARPPLADVEQLLEVIDALARQFEVVWRGLPPGQALVNRRGLAVEIVECLAEEFAPDERVHSG